MLTKEDLQAISEIIDEKLDNKLNPINDRLDNIEEKVDIIEEEVNVIKEEVNIIKERIDNIEEKIDVMHGVNEEVVKWLEKWYGHDFDRPFPVEFEPDPDNNENAS